MKHYILLTIFVLFSAQLKADDECLFPINWAEKSLCLEKTQDQIYLQNELSRMSSLLEQDISRDSQTGLPIFFTDPGGFVSKKKLKKSIAALSNFLAHNQFAEFITVNRSLELNYAEIIPYHYPVFSEIYKYFKLKIRPEEAQGEIPTEVSFSSLRSPVTNISSLDLKFGFKRKASDIPDGVDCKYKEAKTNYGTHPGFTVKCGKKEVKAKFGEYHSEAFGSRIFWALGYNADPVDYLPNMILPYDRRIFTEFNSRKLMKTRFKFGPLVTHELAITLRTQAFKFIDAIELKDGTLLSGKTARKFLVGNSRKKILTDEMIILENEKLISKVHTGPIQVQVEDDFTTFGPWSWKEFGVNKSLEARGTLLLAAWLNWFDCRVDNNRLRLLNSDGALSLQHVISDLGGVLGRSGGNLPFMNSVEKEKAFETHFIERNKFGKIIFPNYRPLNSNQAFNEATESDLMDMAKLILQITPEQIEVALRVAGFSPLEVESYLHKLVHRQTEIRQVFELIQTN